MNGDMWTRNRNNIVEYEIDMKRTKHGQEREPEGSEQVATSFPTLPLKLIQARVPSQNA